ncbi:MAG: hypothetical protein V1707_00880 [bacterium]
MKIYLLPLEQFEIETANTFPELAQIALIVMVRQPQPLGILSGPLTTGGLGQEKNFKAFKWYLEHLAKQGIELFNQMPFEPAMARICNSPYFKDGQQLLNEFYLPLFESGLFTAMYFIPGYKTSNGASWEHEQAKRLGIDRIYL